MCHDHLPFLRLIDSYVHVLIVYVFNFITIKYICYLRTHLCLKIIKLLLCIQVSILKFLLKDLKTARNDFYRRFSWDLLINVSIMEGQWLSCTHLGELSFPQWVSMSPLLSIKFSFKGRIVLMHFGLYLSPKPHHGLPRICWISLNVSHIQFHFKIILALIDSSPFMLILKLRLSTWQMSCSILGWFFCH